MTPWRPANITKHRARRSPTDEGGNNMMSYLEMLYEILEELSPKYIRKLVIYARTLRDIQREREGE